MKMEGKREGPSKFNNRKRRSSAGKTEKKKEWIPLKLMDCTLRDGGNVVGRGFDAELTKMMIEGLIESGITTIEMGNCTGIGSYAANKSIAPCTDVEYLELVQPYLSHTSLTVISRSMISPPFQEQGQ